MTGQQRRMLGVFMVMMLFLGVFLVIRRERQQTAAQQARAQAEAAAARERTMRTVVFARRTIPRRATIARDWLEERDMDEKSLPRHDHFESIDAVVDRVAMSNIYRGEAVHRARVAGRDQVSALSFVIPEGKRAVSIRVNTVDAAGGFVKQGDEVDILATLALTAHGRTQHVTTFLKEGARVLAINQEYELGDREGEEESRSSDRRGQEGRDGSPYRARPDVSHITFLVTPEEAERLIVASGRTNLKLVLRPDTAQTGEMASPVVEAIRPQRVTIDETSITGRPGAGRPGAGQEQLRVEVVRGLTRSEQFVSVQDLSEPEPPRRRPDMDLDLDLIMPELDDVPELPSSEDFGGVELDMF